MFIQCVCFTEDRWQLLGGSLCFANRPTKQRSQILLGSVWPKLLGFYVGKLWLRPPSLLDTVVFVILSDHLKWVNRLLSDCCTVVGIDRGSLCTLQLLPLFRSSALCIFSAIYLSQEVKFLDLHSVRKMLNVRRLKGDACWDENLVGSSEFYGADRKCPDRYKGTELRLFTSRCAS